MEHLQLFESYIDPKLLEILKEKDLLIIKKIVNELDDIAKHDFLYDKLFNYYLNLGEIPYGTANASDGDPYEWLNKRLGLDFKYLKSSD